MHVWIRPSARGAVRGAATARERPWDALAAVRTLDAELSTGRRFWGGTVSVALAVLGGAVLSGVGGARSGPDVVAVAITASLLLGAALCVRIGVLRARHAIVEAFVTWSSMSAPLGPSSVFTGQLSGKSIARTALAAVLFIAAAFSWSSVAAGPWASDDWSFRLSAVVWGVASTVAMLAVVATEVRGNLARTGRIARGRL
ncbi:hypothetical protein BIV01_16775 [Curtobacterium sp. MCBA15_013]|nr:hypothetical protein BIV01_16775 [Curtobacterium sp. MCBA15_013]